MPDKEQFRKQVQTGLNYIRRDDIHIDDQATFLTDHLWGTVGMWLQNAKQEDSRDKISQLQIDEHNAKYQCLCNGEQILALERK